MSVGKKIYLLGDPNLGIYDESVSQSKDKDIREINFNTTFYFAKIIKTMFGPNGLNKMLLDTSNNIIITQKGNKVLNHLKKRLPIVQLLINLAEIQEKLYGDGTKTIILLTAFLLDKAKKLLEKGIPAQIINEGLNLATIKALEVLENSVIEINENINSFLEKLVNSVMMNRISIYDKKIFINYLLNLSTYLGEIEYSDIFYRKVHGKSIKESEIINGMIIYKEKPNFKMPEKIENPKIVLIKRNLDFFIRDNVNINRNIEIDNPLEYKKFLSFTENYYYELSKNLKERGIDIILCEKKMNPTFIEQCATLGMIALELVGEEEIKSLSKLLNLKVISDIQNIEDEEIGTAERAEFKKIVADEMLILSLRNSKIFTFLLRGGTKYILDELEENIRCASKIAIQFMKHKKVLPGGGALESEIACELKKYSSNFSNRLQVVISEIAKAYENIPGYLIKNSGQDPLDLVPKLRKMHAESFKYSGFDANSNKLMNVIDQGIFDDYIGKKNLIRNASEAVQQIIRVNGLIMIRDRDLHKKFEQEKSQIRSQKHEKRLREYFREKEEDLFTI
ncbi:MAG: hypothetical protein EAX96_17925 [Candidatus Lokiarchaeota archaeon]|nr:hypothetical protein [Candidatus Lokiarchaeota archaeon]